MRIGNCRTVAKGLAAAERCGASNPPTGVPPGVGGDGSDGLVRVTVNLTSKSATSLNILSMTTGLSRTDIMNRALQTYELAEELLDRGGGSIVVRHADGELERIFLL
jgi:hypothetical protein